MYGKSVKISTQSIRNLKGQRPVVMLTAYDAIMGRLADESGVDMILVGDSVGTTHLGMESTVTVTIEHMLHHTKAVMQGASRALVVADMPFASAHFSTDSVLTHAVRLIQEGGARAIKIEGGVDRAPVIAHCVQAGIPVVGHIGLQPQQYHALGGYRKFGKKASERECLLEDAKALEEAGVFCMVAEMVTPELTEQLCEAVSIPIIGIGCQHPADGQVLVCTDLLGMGNSKIPSFVKKYAQLNQTIAQAFSSYVQDVQSKQFP